MSKKCQAPNCTYSVFSHNFCQNHQYLRKDESYLKKLLVDLKRGKIKPKSNKRMEQDKEYIKVKEQKEIELKQKGEWKCIFCGIGFYDTEYVSWHHLLGRDGELMVDEKYIWPSHDNCHIRDYHQADYEHLKRMFWYEKFLERIKNIDINLYNKEKRKQYRYENNKRD